jgi:hypothetical protein
VFWAGIFVLFFSSLVNRRDESDLPAEDKIGGVLIKSRGLNSRTNTALEEKEKPKSGKKSNISHDVTPSLKKTFDSWVCRMKQAASEDPRQFEFYSALFLASIPFWPDLYGIVTRSVPMVELYIDYIKQRGSYLPAAGAPVFDAIWHAFSAVVVVMPILVFATLLVVASIVSFCWAGGGAMHTWGKRGRGADLAEWFVVVVFSLASLVLLFAGCSDRNGGGGMSYDLQHGL